MSFECYNEFRKQRRRSVLKACPHCHRKVRQFVAEKCDCRRIRQLSPLSRRFLRQSHFSVTVWTGLKKEGSSTGPF